MCVLNTFLRPCAVFRTFWISYFVSGTGEFISDTILTLPCTERGCVKYGTSPFSERTGLAGVVGSGLSY